MRKGKKKTDKGIKPEEKEKVNAESAGIHSQMQMQTNIIIKRKKIKQTADKKMTDRFTESIAERIVKKVKCLAYD